MKKRLRSIAVCLLAITGIAPGAMAREPGVPTAVPAGNMMGIPAGANPPPGLYLNSRSGVWDATLADGDGNDAGQSNKLADTALQLLWVPGWQVLGGSYRALVTLPLISNRQSRSAPFPPPLQGDSRRRTSGSLEISPIGLSWQVSPGIFTSAALSLFAPVSSFDTHKGINGGGDFWTASPSLGGSYLRDGWNISAHAAWFTSTESRSTDYRSGNEVMVNLTALRDMGGYSLGPVAYWRKQLTDDRNKGQYYGGTAADRAEQLGIGLGFAGRLNAVDVNVNITDDVRTRNTIGGPRLWVNLGVPLTRRN